MALSWVRSLQLLFAVFLKLLSIVAERKQLLSVRLVPIDIDKIHPVEIRRRRASIPGAKSPWTKPHMLPGSPDVGNLTGLPAKNTVVFSFAL